MRKSTLPQKTVAENANKYESPREAWSKIRLAQKNGLFLEAMTIQESIISDRLIDYLSSSTASNPVLKNKNGQWPLLSKLIQHWRTEFPNGLQIGSYTDIITAVNQWRTFRNEAIHAIVKSEPGQSTQSIDAFLEKTKQAAEEGERLARELSNWCSKEQKKRMKMEGISSIDEVLPFSIDDETLS